MKEIIDGRLRVMKLTLPRLAVITGIPYGVLWRRMKNPDTLTKGEIFSISKAIEVPVCVLMKAE